VKIKARAAHPRNLIEGNRYAKGGKNFKHQVNKRSREFTDEDLISFFGIYKS
jgi:hypothetical protein